MHSIYPKTNKGFKVIVILLLLGSMQFLYGLNLAYMVENGQSKRVAYGPYSDKSKHVMIPNSNPWNLYPQIGADSKEIIFLEGEDINKLAVKLYHINGMKIDSYSENDITTLHPSISGNSRYIAYSYKSTSAQEELYKIRVLDRQKCPGAYKPECVSQVITGELGNLFFPKLSSDGHFLIYQQSGLDQKKTIHLYDLFSKQTKQLTADYDISMSPDLSFNDHYIIYTHKVTDSHFKIIAQNLATSITTTIIDHESRNLAPHFFPNNQIIFSSDRRGSFDLYTAEWREGQKNPSVALPYTTSSNDIYAPSISGDGNFIQAQLQGFPEPARSSFGAAQIAEKIFIVGGHQGGEHTYPPESFLDRMDYYDLMQNKWLQAKSRPVKAHGYQIVAHNKYLYAFGGFAYSPDHNPKWKSLADIHRYDTTTDSWQYIGALPRPRSSHSAIKVGSKVYLMGGWDATPKYDGDYDGHFHEKIDIFDLDSESISTLGATFKAPLRRAITAIRNGFEIIILGGISQGADHFNLLNHVSAFNTRTNSWNEYPKLPSPTFAPAAEILEDNIYLFGGMEKFSDEDYRYTNHIIRFSFADKKWEHTGRYLNESKGFSQVLNLYGSSIAILGGHHYEQDHDSPLNSFEIFSLK